ncbi:RNA polymerase II-associated protein 1 [Bagarius yarrelli]|uniref:RNA polymerase II-associated protein 1 n=1 Tax=Bagarius yarrelli TaxID=175774 RepID=A0A556U7Q3_BAGYA|nr:RNA polymerase II-associated protein 1 [Bagarius yarrelli]
MDKLEPEKLEWMSELPPPRKKGTKQAMQARFDFSGILIPPTEDLPTHLGLHHHGEDPELAGYSLQELFLLSRSQLTQQRSLALNTLAHILSKACAGEYSSCLKGNVLASLLDAGLLFLLRFSLDDSVEGVMSAAVRALRALLVSTEDEENLDNTFPWLLGMASFPLVPQLHKEDDDEDDEGQKETEKQKEERQLDHDIAQKDVIKGLLKMQLLQRLRYILEVVRPSPQTVLDILEILIRIARYSVSAATQILDCPRLMETVMSDFLPCVWSVMTSPTPPSLYGFPVSKANKALASVGKRQQACLCKNSGKERLSRFLSVKPSELLLESRENICCSTEALRLWAVAASYGQPVTLYNLYKDLYPVLIETLQAAHKPCAPSESLIDLELHRLKSLLVLLTQVTHTAGCHQELKSGLSSSQGADGLPPPPVMWSNVAGLQPAVMGILKGCIKKLDDPSQRSSTLSLLPAYMIYMGTYYSQLYLQELEALTTEVLLPLISHQVFHRIIDSLRSNSVICNAGIATSAQTLPSLPGLGSSMVQITSLLEPETPLPLCTALFYLLDNILTIHRGLTKSFSSLVLMDSVLTYLQSCVEATPLVTHASAWILRHEHHFLYLILRLAHRLVPSHSEVKKNASLFHQVALALLSWLLPGNEYLAHELVSTVIFNQDLFPETCSGGPEAATLAELHLEEMYSQSPSSGPLLSDSLAQLSLIRACYLTHFAYLEPAVITSRERHLGRNPWLFSQLLPELSGPSLPSDWAFLPLISLYERIGVSQGGGLRVESLPAGSVQSLTHCLQWLLVLESFRERALQLVPPVAKLARLVCIFLCSSDIFLEKAVKELMWALLRGLTRAGSLEALDLSLPPPGLASFYDLYSALLTQYEAVSFGDSLFGCFILLPLQRRYSVSMRLAVFGEHVSILRSLGVSLVQLPIALEKFTSPAEDSLPLLQLYFRALVTKALRRNWSPVLYVVAVAHLNAFIFSQDAVPQEVETTRRSLLRKTYYLTDEVLRSHLLLFRLPHQNSELGFSTYEQLTPIRACRLQNVIKIKEGNDWDT